MPEFPIPSARILLVSPIQGGATALPAPLPGTPMGELSYVATRHRSLHRRENVALLSNILWPVGGRLTVGPVFRRTCWTCLNRLLHADCIWQGIFNHHLILQIYTAERG